MTDRCPWCDDPVTPAADPVAVRPEQVRGREMRLHHQCAIEWQQFIERARDLAAGGHRWALLDGPLEAGWQLESSVDGSRLADE
ncbi:MAG: hypothetical protein ABEI77_02180 [Halorientalis sp.]